MSAILAKALLISVLGLILYKFGRRHYESKQTLLQEVDVYIPKEYARHCQVVGKLHKSDKHELLSQDMIEVQIDGDVLITCGWVPASSPYGRYEIVATQGLYDLCNPTYTTDAQKASDRITELIMVACSDIDNNCAPRPEDG